MDNIKEPIRQYVLNEFLPGESPANLTNATPLRTSGRFNLAFVNKLFRW